jgi:hypothetical protein
MGLPGAPPPAVWRDPSDDPALERWLRVLAVPLALALGFAVARSGLRGLGRMLLSMWVHELGHAVTAWLCGFGAFPGPWITPMSHDRMAVVSLGLAALLGYALARAAKARRGWVCAGLGALLLLQAELTLGLRPHAARAIVLFGGDAGCLVLGSVGMLTFYAPPDSPLARNWLRWGFLVIGAVAFMDAFATWWDARHTAEGVVFGENVGVGDTDPTRLVFEYGWSEARLVSRYLTLAWSCLLVVAGVYAAGLWTGRRADQSTPV